MRRIMFKNRIIFAIVAAFMIMSLSACGKKDSASAEKIAENKSGFPSLNSFNAKTLDGGEFTDAGFNDYDVTIINVWGITCGPCIREMPEIAEYRKNLPEKVQFLTWCVDAYYYPEETKQVLKEAGYDGITITSGDGDLEEFLNELIYTPTTVAVDKDGNIIGEAMIGAPSNFKDSYDIFLDDALKAIGK